jgi:predicted RND superfamily exporter protein
MASTIEQFATDDFAVARITVRLDAVGSARQGELIEKIEAHATETMSPHLRTVVTGRSKVFIKQMSKIVTTQIDSFTMCFVIITILMIIYVRSFKLALLSLPVNLFPILATLGAMGIFGINLDISTIMIASIAICIAVDDTIHFISRFHAEQKKGNDVITSIDNTLHSSGRAMMYTTLVMGGGFFIFCFSSFATNRYFGILMSFTMILAIIGDLLIYPYLIKLFGVSHKDD